MKREIKFRIWKINLAVGEKKEMIYFLVKACMMLPLWQSDDILMQFTGLKDKNGKEIFEGDVLKDKDNTLYVVKEGVSGIRDCIGFITREIRKDDVERSKFISHIQTDCEVIGNIYENPELLEGE